MKVDDIVMFSKKHTSRPGFEYCAEWLGVILERSSTRVDILWTIPGECCFTTYYDSHIPIYKEIEVISEDR